jgi:hypothetical protein
MEYCKVLYLASCVFEKELKLVDLNFFYWGTRNIDMTDIIYSIFCTVGKFYL